MIFANQNSLKRLSTIFHVDGVGVAWLEPSLSCPVKVQARCIPNCACELHECGSMAADKSCLLDVVQTVTHFLHGEQTWAPARYTS